MGRGWAVAAIAAAAAGTGCHASLLAYSGTTGSRESDLGWYLLITSAVVIVVITLLVLIAGVRAGRRRDAEPTRPLIPRTGAGISWVMIGGIIVPAVILLGTFIFTIVTLDAVATPATPPVATIQVIGHQWWWEVHYLSDTSSLNVTTANEIHVPVGEPVKLELQTADVIHSFWVPQLAGKTDLIPGQTNVTWIEARRPGAYYGHCGEYCGVQHAHMQVIVIAQSPAAYRAWLAKQRKPQTPPTDPGLLAGQRVFLGSACSSCHTIQGTPAGGHVGPDLTHLASRRTIAAGTLPNTRGNLAGWITDAQGVKPGTLMPSFPLPPHKLQTLLGYLASLR